MTAEARCPSRVWLLLAASLCAQGCGRTGVEEGEPAGVGPAVSHSCPRLRAAGPPVQAMTAAAGLWGSQLVQLSDDGSRAVLFGLVPEDITKPTKGLQQLMWGQLEPFAAWPPQAEVWLVPAPVDTQVYGYRAARQRGEHVLLAYEREDLGSTWVAYDMPVEQNVLGPAAFLDDGAVGFVASAEGHYLFGTGQSRQKLRVLRKSTQDWAFEPARSGICSAGSIRMGAATTEQGWLVATTERQSSSCDQQGESDRLVLQAVERDGDWEPVWEWPMFNFVESVQVVPAAGGAWVLWMRRGGGAPLMAARVTDAGELLIGPYQLTDSTTYAFAAVRWHEGLALAWSDSRGVSVATFDAQGQPLDWRIMPHIEMTTGVNESPALLASADQRSLLVGYSRRRTGDEPGLLLQLARFDCRD